MLFLFRLKKLFLSKIEPMKKLLLSAFIMLLAGQSFAQTAEEKADLSFLYSKIGKYATRVKVFKTRASFVLNDPKVELWQEALKFQTSETEISIAMNTLEIARVEPYGIELTGPNGQATIFMDLAADAPLREELQYTLDNRFGEEDHVLLCHG